MDKRSHKNTMFRVTITKATAGIGSRVVGCGDSAVPSRLFRRRTSLYDGPSTSAQPPVAGRASPSLRSTALAVRVGSCGRRARAVVPARPAAGDAGMVAAEIADMVLLAELVIAARRGPCVPTRMAAPWVARLERVVGHPVPAAGGRVHRRATLLVVEARPAAAGARGLLAEEPDVMRLAERRAAPPAALSGRREVLPAGDGRSWVLCLRVIGLLIEGSDVAEFPILCWDFRQVSEVPILGWNFRPVPILGWDFRQVSAWRADLTFGRGACSKKRVCCCKACHAADQHGHQQPMCCNSHCRSDEAWCPANTGEP
mmetsp:Transcript_11340/g.12669  ORF Transcript_11340/g.12669 Transcript_11340/m.12669 type:complete len:314 (-) Transcript_11340:72-1013(-)